MGTGRGTDHYARDANRWGKDRTDLSRYSKLIDVYEAPIDISQDGIAAALRISRAHAALELKKLKEGKEVSERLSHIKRGKTKRKVYFLTRQGEERAKNINQFAEDNSIDLSQYQDIRKCRGPELWKTLDEKHKPVVSMSVFSGDPSEGTSFLRSSVSLLPVDQNGMVDLPKELKDYVVSITNPEKLRDYHSFAADYWMHWGDIREVLYHLVGARRFVDAEIMVCSSMKELLLQADEDLVDIISNIRDTTKGYSGQVHYAQAEVARRVGRQEYCLILTKGMEASSIPSERFDGYLIEGRLHMDRKEYQLAYRSFLRARGVYDDRLHIELELNIADSLIRSEDYHEAQEILFSRFQRVRGPGR